METIQVTKKIKKEFEKDRFQIRQKEDRLVTQNEFMDLLIKCWRLCK